MFLVQHFGSLGLNQYDHDFGTELAPAKYQLEWESCARTTLSRCLIRLWKSSEKVIHQYILVQLFYHSDVPSCWALHSAHPLVQHHHAPGHLPPQLHGGNMLATLQHTLAVQGSHHGQLVTKDPVVSPGPVTKPYLGKNKEGIIIVENCFID